MSPTKTVTKHMIVLAAICSSITTVFGSINGNQLVRYSSLHTVAIYDRCAQKEVNYFYNISITGRIECFELKCNKTNQQEYNGQCLNCPASGCSCPSGMSLKKASDSLLECRSNKYNIQNDGENMIVQQLPCSITNYLSSKGYCNCTKYRNINNQEYSLSPSSTLLPAEESQKGVCLLNNNYKNLLINNEYLLLYSTVNYGNNHKFLSSLIYNSLKESIYECFNDQYSNLTACNHLLNICTLKLTTEFTYQSSRNDYTNLCLYLSRINNSFVFNYPEYSLSTYIPQEFKSFDDIDLIILSYSLNGTYLGKDEFVNYPLKAFFHCWNNQLKHQRIYFGQNLIKKCYWNIQELLNYSANEPKFYEFYLRIPTQSEKNLVPIPVEIYNYNNNEYLFWKLKRFFFSNSHIGIEDETLKLLFIIYTKNILIEFQLNTADKQNIDYTRILLPRILIEYRIIEADNFNDEHFLNKNKITKLEIKFFSNDPNGMFNLRMTLFITIFLSILWSIFKTIVWQQRSGRNYFSNICRIFLIFLLKLCQAISNLFLIVLFIYLLNRLLIFKYQQKIHSLLPSKSNETEIIIYLFIIFILKLIQILAKIRQLINMEIFFIDWEKPRKKFSQQTMPNESLETRHKSATSIKLNSDGGHYENNHQYHNNTNGNNNTKIQDNNNNVSIYKRIKQRNRFESLVSYVEQLNTPVTIWRTYFVANEWYELSKKRRINLFAHICIVVLLLEGSQFSKQFIRSMPIVNNNNGNKHYEFDNLDEVSPTIVGRFVFAGFVYLFIGYLLYFYQRFLCEACGASKLNEFMDLCTVSNISIFCLVEHRFGYYLHGLSPNGRSEVNMMEMYELLEMEESDLCSKRGLIANTEQQTFEMFLPGEIYTNLVTLRRPVDACQPTFLERCFACSENSRENFRNLSKEKLFQVYLSINRFLTGFIDHTFEEVDYRVVDRNKWESLFGFEKNSNSAKFYNDNGSSMENILFFGLEVTFITFEMLSFLVVDFLSGGNFMLAGIGAAALSLLIKHIYIRGTRRNLVQKTLIDERFLI